MADDAPKTYSVSLRVRRTTIEYTYVSVFVDSSIMQTDQAGNVVLDERGFAHIAPEKMTSRAIELSKAQPTRWFLESQSAEPHPIQKAPEPEERVGL